MAIPINKELYQKVKLKADNVYSKSSAYKSGYIVKEYKRMGGKYKDNDKKEKDLKRWFSEKWININPDKKGYPVLRPSVRINEKTPILSNEISKKNKEEQIKLKQTIKGKKNLPKFVKK